MLLAERLDRPAFRSRKAGRAPLSPMERTLKTQISTVKFYLSSRIFYADFAICWSIPSVVLIIPLPLPHYENCIRRLPAPHNSEALATELLGTLAASVEI